MATKTAAARYGMSNFDEYVEARGRVYGFWRRRMARLALASCIVSFSAVTTLPMPSAAAADGVLVPICANGAVRYIVMSFAGSDETPLPDEPSNGAPAACHGPCLHERKRPGGPSR